MFNLNPMLCRQVREPFDRPGWIFEVKWDGFRTIAEVDGGKVSLYSRRLNSFNGRFSQVARSLESLGHTAVLDGEIVALDEEGHPRFEWLFHRGKGGKCQLVYFVFDLLYLDGNDLRREPLHRRKSRLKRIIKKIPHLIYVDHIEEHGKEFFALASKLGLGGIVGKDKRSLYVSGRETRDWLKIKNPAFQRKEPIEKRQF